MSWDPLTDPVDKALIAGRITPGLCTIVGADSPRRWEEREGYGLSGSIIWFRGVKLSHFEIRFRLYTEVDWQDWHAFRSIVAKPPYGKRARAVDIWHPLTEEVGIKSIVIENWLAPEQTEPGEWTIVLKVIEFRHPKYALAKPEGSEATPVDPVEQQIAANSQQIAELAGELAEP